MVNIGAGTAPVAVASEVTCSLGGRSVPIVVGLGAVPHTDITLSVAVKEYDATVEDAVDPSAGLTPDDTVLTLNWENPVGNLGFACAADATGTELVYTLGGTDAAAFTLSSTSITVTT